MLVRSTPMLPQWHVKDPSHSAKSVGGRLCLNVLYCVCVCVCVCACVYTVCVCMYVYVCFCVCVHCCVSVCVSWVVKNALNVDCDRM